MKFSSLCLRHVSGVKAVDVTSVETDPSGPDVDKPSNGTDADADVLGESEVGYITNFCTNENKHGTDADADVSGDSEIGYHRDDLAFTSRSEIPPPGYISMGVDLENRVHTTFTSRVRVCQTTWIRNDRNIRHVKNYRRQQKDFTG